MNEEPYRWLEAVANRREYVREQLKGGSPAFAASLPDGVLLLGVGSGQSKVFELFDRHAHLRHHQTPAHDGGRIRDR